MHFLGISVVEFEEVNVGWGRSTIGFTVPVDHVTLLKGASRQFLFLTSSLISASKKPMFVIRKININEIVKAVLQIMSVCSINLDIFFFFWKSAKDGSIPPEILLWKVILKICGKEKKEKTHAEPWFQLSFKGLLFFFGPQSPVLGPRSQPSAPAPSSVYFSTAPGSNYFFAIPMYQINFPWPRIIKITIPRPCW